jgi:hypothetical protein
MRHGLPCRVVTALPVSDLRLSLRPERAVSPATCRDTRDETPHNNTRRPAEHRAPHTSGVEAGPFVPFLVVYMAMTLAKVELHRPVIRSWT